MPHKKTVHKLLESTFEVFKNNRNMSDVDIYLQLKTLYTTAHRMGVRFALKRFKSDESYLPLGDPE